MAPQGRTSGLFSEFAIGVFPFKIFTLNWGPYDNYRCHLIQQYALSYHVSSGSLLFLNDKHGELI